MTNFVTGCLTAILVFIVYALILGTCVMWLWNWLMPMLFGLTTITWIQALGIYTLTHLLFASNESKVNNNSNN